MSAPAAAAAAATTTCNGGGDGGGGAGVAIPPLPGGGGVQPRSMDTVASVLSGKERYIRSIKLGEGTFGDVYLADDKLVSLHSPFPNGTILRPSPSPRASGEQ